MARFIPRGLGWCRDLPDPRDYTPGQEQVIGLLAMLKRPARRSRSLPSAIDLRRDDEAEYFSPVEDQGSLNASPAFAVLSLVEYFERRSLGRTFEGSQSFLYKLARKLAHREGNTGIDLRTTLKALVRFGVPPVGSSPDPCDAEPVDPSLFAYARDYASMCYARLDQRNADGQVTLGVVKSFLAAGFPIAFGFSVPSSLSSSPDIPYRPDFDSIRGGQAVVAVGYDDRRAGSPGGALLIRSSWGEVWGDCGYGWLPYRYVERQLAADFWIVLREDWLLVSEFHQPLESADVAAARR